MQLKTHRIKDRALLGVELVAMGARSLIVYSHELVCTHDRTAADKNAHQYVRVEVKNVYRYKLRMSALIALLSALNLACKLVGEG